MEHLIEFFRNNKKAAIGLIIGLIWGTLLITVGIFKTLLLSACGAVGLLAGWIWDDPGRFHGIIHYITSHNNNNDEV